MTERVTSYIPPLAVSQMIGSYHFEGRGYVAIVGEWSVPTEDALDAAQALIDLKRREMASSDAGNEPGTNNRNSDITKDKPDAGA